MSGIDYFKSTAISNSTLSKFKQDTSGKDASSSDNAFRLGTLIDAMVTEPTKVQWISRKVAGTDYDYTKQDFDWAVKMKQAFFSNGICKQIHAQSVLQKEFYVERSFGEIGEIPVRCKYDGFLQVAGWGWDLKTLASEDIDAAIEMFDYDRAIYFYMTVSQSDKFCVFPINKRKFTISPRYITKGDITWQRGRDKCLTLLQNYITIYGIPEWK